MSRQDEDRTTVRVVPAHLEYLTIYNPSFAPTEETEADQILFYYAQDIQDPLKSAQKLSSNNSSESIDINVQLRNIGLAQGLVNFGSAFANGKAVTSVDTEKHRIVLKELEPNWWILASIHLTILPSTRKTSADVDSKAHEFSSREVSPATLLIQQLSIAHRVFLLHHGPSLEHILKKVQRHKFCGMLQNFWSKFARNWDVLLNGNPSCDIYAGLKLAAGGELGVGVGEEDWGSGERDVLEGLIRNSDGMVDLMAFRYGDEQQSSTAARATSIQSPPNSNPVARKWLGQLVSPQVSDGAIFTGLGSLAVSSQAAISHWINMVYTSGEDAYGIDRNPRNTRPRRKRQTSPIEVDQTPSEPSISPKDSPPDIGSRLGNASDSVSQTDFAQDNPSSKGPGIPPPIVSAAEESLRKASAAAVANQNGSDPPASSGFGAALANTDNWVKYLTLGYGQSWHKNAKHTEHGHGKMQSTSEIEVKAEPQTSLQASPSAIQAAPLASSQNSQRRPPLLSQDSSGHFLVGYKGSLILKSGDDEKSESQFDEDHRLTLRTLHVEIKENVHGTSVGSETSASDTTIRRVTNDDVATVLRSVRVVVYAHQPFIYVAVFDRHASTPTLPAFFKELHNHLKPLHKSLLASTAPANVLSRFRASLNQKLSASVERSPVFHCIFDPITLHVHSTIPSIWPPGEMPPSSAKLAEDTISRLDALNMHAHILSEHDATRDELRIKERQSRTNRDWWIHWMRLVTKGRGHGTKDLIEAFLVRRTEQFSVSPRHASTRHVSGPATLGLGFPSLPSMSSFMRSSAPSTSSQLQSPASANKYSHKVSGTGIDARSYVENLLSLNR